MQFYPEVAGEVRRWFGGIRVRTRGRAFARDLRPVSIGFGGGFFQLSPARISVHTGRLSSVLLDSCSLSVESVVLGTSEGVLGGRMALWHTGRSFLGETLSGAQ